MKNKAEAEKKLQALVAKAKSGETLTDAEQKAYRTYRTEVGAFANQRLLGNKSFVKKLITTEPSTAEKLIGKLREIRENLKARKDPDAREQLDFVRKAEKLFMQGLSEAGGTIDSNGKIHLANKEDDEGDKVFTKKEVAAAISTIDALQKLPAKERSELVTHLWRGYNERLNEQGFGYSITA